MGCDGGTIPTRGELVKTKKKPEQLSKETELAVKWQHCAISQEPLGQQVVSCRLGQLYNKEALIEFLLTRSKSSGGAEERLDHIRGLKDFKELRLTPNPAFHVASDTKYGAGATGERMNTARFICPVTGLEMNGRFRFSYLLTCGCTFSERALVEVREAGSAGCLQCGRAFTREDVVPINGDAEEVGRLRERVEAEKQARLSKKGKRAKTAGGEEGVTICSDEPASKKQKQDCASSSGESSQDSSNADKSRKDVVKQGDDALEVQKPAQQCKDGENGNSGRNVESGRSGDSERSGESGKNDQKSGDSGKNGHRRGDSTKKGDSRSGDSNKNGHRSEDNSKNGHRSGDNSKNGHRNGDNSKNGHRSGDSSKNGHSSKNVDKGKKLMKNGESGSSDTKKVKSIQQDSSATETYKSLFNTHPTALKQGKAHWVTYNPQYN